MVSSYTTPHARPGEEARQAFASAFGELRSVLAAPPDPARWGALVRCVEPWLGLPEREQVLVAYAAPHLDRWPSVWRRAPQEWLRRASMGERVEALTLTRVWAPSLDARWYQRAPQRLSELLEHPALARVQHLELNRLLCDARLVRALGERVSGALTSLAIEELDAPNTTLLPLLTWPEHARPTRFMARSNLLDDQFARALIESAWWGDLRALDLSSNRLSRQGTALLRARGGHLDELALDGPCLDGPDAPSSGWRGAP